MCYYSKHFCQFSLAARHGIAVAALGMLSIIATDEIWALGKRDKHLNRKSVRDPHSKVLGPTSSKDLY